MPIKQILAILLLSFSSLSWSQDCKFNYPANAKACPTSGSTLLDDTYPVSSYVISIQPQRDSPKASEVPSSFILKMLESHDFSENAPNIIVPSSFESFRELKAALEKKIAESNGKIPRSILTKVIPAKGNDYTWQQDYFESFFDPATGRPVNRRIASYDRNSMGFDPLSYEAGSCGVTKGPVITQGKKSFANGEMGGNIEGLPGGLCLVGDNQSADFTKQFCGDESNIVKVDVSWLKVGHVDELIKVVPTNIPGVPAECNFSVAFASPKKAIELLSEPRAANHPLLAGDFLKEGATKQEQREFRLSRNAGRAGKKLCEIYQRFGTPRPAAPGKTTPGGVKKAYYFIKDLMLVPRAFAGSEDEDEEKELIPLEAFECGVETLTNSQFLQGMNHPKFKDYNELVQKKMDESKKKVTDQILARLPQCQKYLNVIDVPDLFFGKMAVASNGTKSLPLPGDGGSFLPNPTNSVVGNKTLVFSDPQNPLFRDYLEKEYAKGGVKAGFIDTWDYAHVGDGDLHCSSHSIPFCSPATKVVTP